MFDLFYHSLLRWLKIDHRDLLVLYRVFTLGGVLLRNVLGITLDELPLLGYDGDVQVRLGEFPLVCGLLVLGGHVDVTAGIRARFAFGHQFPSVIIERVE